MRGARTRIRLELTATIVTHDAGMKTTSARLGYATHDPVAEV